MKQKNVEAIKMLLRIAHAEGNFLKGAACLLLATLVSPSAVAESWYEVLQCISEFERLQLIGGPAVDVFDVRAVSARLNRHHWHAP
jgi:brefeldin A-inhibited guanine nucleotide-exchange protein